MTFNHYKEEKIPLITINILHKINEKNESNYFFEVMISII